MKKSLREERGKKRKCGINRGIKGERREEGRKG